MSNEELEEYTPHLRIKSLRRRKRMIREAFDKKLLAMLRESWVIRKQIRGLGYEPLDPPIQRGWRRVFVLREDVARSKDARFFQGILDKINTTHYHWRKDFKIKKRQRGKKLYVVKPQSLEEPTPYFFAKLKFTEKEKAYFDLTHVFHHRSSQLEYKYVFTEPWRFVLKIEPNIITRTKIRDFDLERRSKEMWMYLDRANLWPKALKLEHGSYQNRNRYIFNEQKKYISPFLNRSFTDILDEYWPEPEMKVEYRNPREAGGFLFSRFYEWGMSIALAWLRRIKWVVY
jgi:hypothetical protein